MKPNLPEHESDHALVVISYYDRRSTAYLNSLLASLAEHDAGMSFQVALVINRTVEAEINVPENLPFRLRCFYRENTGMNIGAWDYGWRQNKQFQYYLFLQDECYAIRSNWLLAFKEYAEKINSGLVAESINDQWDIEWQQLAEREKYVDLPEHLINGKPVNRVLCYMDFLKRMGIAKGVTARHARSLIWFISGEVLATIDGFPVGLNYGECIASEIGVSKKIESLGLNVERVGSESFTYFRHKEWAQDFSGGAFTKKPSMLHQFKKLQAKLENSQRYIEKLIEQNEDLKTEVDSLRGKDKKQTIKECWRFFSVRNLLGIIRKKR